MLIGSSDKWRFIEGDESIDVDCLHFVVPLSIVCRLILTVLSLNQYIFVVQLKVLIIKEVIQEIGWPFLIGCLPTYGSEVKLSF